MGLWSSFVFPRIRILAIGSQLEPVSKFKNCF